MRKTKRREWKIKSLLSINPITFVSIFWQDLFCLDIGSNDEEQQHVVTLAKTNKVISQNLFMLCIKSALAHTRAIPLSNRFYAICEQYPMLLESLASYFSFDSKTFWKKNYHNPYVLHWISDSADLTRFPHFFSLSAWLKLRNHWQL